MRAGRSIVSVAATLMAAGTVQAGDDGPAQADLRAELERVRELRERYQDRLSELEALQQDLRDRVDAAGDASAGKSPRLGAAAEEDSMRSRGGQAPDGDAAADGAVDQASGDVPADKPGQAPDGRREVEAALPAISERSGVLTPAGTLTLEPQLSYTVQSNNQVNIEGFTVIPAITIGQIEVREIDRRTVTSALKATYGVTDRFELDVRVPYLYRTQDTFGRPIQQGASQNQTLQDVTGDGLGDIELGAHYQLPRLGRDWPSLIANLNVKAPTGTSPFEVPLDDDGLEQELPTGSGFWGVEPSMTALFPSDPVVFWANAGYVWNVGEEKSLQTGDTVDIDPGDTIRLSAGMGISLNRKASLSVGYKHSYVGETEQDGREVADSDVESGVLSLGGSYSLNASTSVNLTVDAGITEDAPDARILLRIPVSLQLFDE